MSAHERWVFVGRAVDPPRLVWQRVEFPNYRRFGATYHVAHPLLFWPRPKREETK